MIALHERAAKLQPRKGGTADLFVLFARAIRAFFIALVLLESTEKSSHENDRRAVQNY